RVALVAHGAPPLHELALSGPVTFVLGAERHGLPAEIVEQSDSVATIATSGAAESLNVAVAGAIALYERSRR
ncbi:MAG: TrmH family RNA methyltransferase, partial [Gaiellaceae bacterium]